MVIGIGGVSRSGKTTLAKQLCEHFKSQTCVIISQDDYAAPGATIPKINGITDWECPESIDFNRFADSIGKAKEAYQVIIVEGLMVFHNNILDSFFDKRIFVEITQPTFLHRKAQDHRWGSLPSWYPAHIWTSYLKYGQQNSLAGKSLIINGEQPFDINTITSYLQS